MSAPRDSRADAISASEASRLILESVPRMADESVPLTAALGSVLAASIHASVTLPPWANASMDGYAVRATDLARAPTRLRVIGTVPAGSLPHRALARGEAMKVMTGAPVPEGADSVIRIEDTDQGAESVEIRALRDVGKNIRPRGEDYREGALLAEVGDTVTPARLGVLASAGVASVRVYRRPLVAILASGDELVPLDRFDAVRGGTRIVSSSSYALAALAKYAGGVPHDLGIAADSREALRAKIHLAQSCDLLVTTGGVSVGDHDYTRAVLEDMGAAIRFTRVRIRPGGPLSFGILGDHPWIGLPGNPVSAMVTFELFVRPALRKMGGHSLLFPSAIPVTLAEPVTVTGDLTHFLRVVVTVDGDGYRATLTGTQS
ncbi:MAG TPA: gephyrin-like molybdotransferase Glp, partial [Candidatus Elarobacter sp.]|nr:gephyrin-like molybdotransferase Glp [Candidatus Elarobacter sp.]